MLKYSIVATAFVISASAFASNKNAPKPRHYVREPSLVHCQSAPNFPFYDATIEDAGFRLMYINGVLYKNWTYAAVPTVERGKVIAKIWGPGFDPTDPLGDSAMVICEDPNPPPPPKPYYYPDTYK